MTGIEWVLNPDGSRGITINSKTGCLNHIDGLCKGGDFPCYAYKLAHERLKPRYLGNDNWPKLILNEGTKWPIGYHPSTDPFYPRFWPERLDKIRTIKKPTGIFLDDMSDWMGDYWREEWTRQELEMMRDCPQHRFYTLTKQPQRLPGFSPFPDNCWVGVTATNHDMTVKALHYLFDVQAKVKFISLEPLLGKLDTWGPDFCGVGLPCEWDRIDWLIIGACTGPMGDLLPLHHKTGLAMIRYGSKWILAPQVEWVSEIVEAADKARIPVFLKNNLAPLIHKDALSGQYALDTGLLTWEGALRQEMPK